MATPFSRSLRSIEHDTYRPSLLGMSLLGLFIAAWLSWFFLAEVGLYEASSDARLTSSTYAVAEFPPSALGRVQPGQTARLRLDSLLWLQYGTVAATVTEVVYTGKRVHVVLSLAADTVQSIPLQSGLTGVIEVQVARLSPAALILRAAGVGASPPAGTTGRFGDGLAHR